MELLNKGKVIKLRSFSKIVERPEKVVYSFPSTSIQRALVLTPHPDDETLGCGGTAYSLYQKGVKVSVVLATDGNSSFRDENIAHIRSKEFQSAAKILGFSNTYLLGYPDGKLNEYQDSAEKRIREIINEEKPDIVFTPYVFDLNPDHVSTSNILKNCINPEDRLVIVMYEVWTPILHPDCYYNISNVFDIKLSAIQCYESQERYYGIRDKAIALNSLRARLSMRRNVMYMEAFKLFNPQEYIDAIEVLTEIATMSE
ncbi:MAG: PIG-L deacetylase family protein [Clostridia bacterium]